MPYQFYLVCADVVYFYTQHGITTYIPDFTYDFVLLADYVQPERVKDRELEYKKLDDTSIELTVKAHQAYLMECKMK